MTATPAQVDAFRRAWHAADDLGSRGGRVQAGLDAALRLVPGAVELERTLARLEHVERGRRLCEAARLSAGDYTLLRLYSEGLNRPEVARRLYVSENTVSARTSKLFRKLGVHSRAEALKVTGWD